MDKYLPISPRETSSVSKAESGGDVAIPCSRFFCVSQYATITRGRSYPYLGMASIIPKLENFKICFKVFLNKIFI